MAPKPAVTNTVTRGGFGETVAKQTSMQRSSATLQLRLSQHGRLMHETYCYYRAPGLA